MKSTILLLGAIGLSSSASECFAAQNLFSVPARVGFTLSALKGDGAAITADFGPLLMNNTTLGGELYGLHLVSIRGLIWENPSSLSGFVGGPKILVGFKPNIAFELAGEFGWNYRFASKVDVGLGADIVLGEYIGGTFKLTLGYLL